IGELWQLDASPHRWFPGSKIAFPMLNMLDDCSRLFTGSKLYERELLLSYFDFLPAAFLAHGRPLQLYVDYHSIFFTHDPDALTQLGWALKFYDISLRYAPTLRRPRARSNGNINSGRAACRPTSPVKRFPNWRKPTGTSTRCATTATQRRSIANCAKPRNAPGTQPKRKSAPSCAPCSLAPGGLMSGACAPPLRSAAMAACPLAPNACASKNHPAPPSFYASIPPAITP